MNRLVAIFLFMLLLPSCRDCGVRPKYVLRLGHQANERDIWHLSAIYFAHVLDSLSEGRIEVQVFPSEQLGSELDMIRSVRAGIVEMTITGESMQNWAGITALLAVPYLIRDSDHLRQVVEGDIGRAIAQEMIQTIGVRPVGYFERGPRHLTSNRPVVTPENLNGMILRVPNVPLFVRVWQALGAKPTPMAFSEVFTALQQGTVEAQENPFALILSAGLYEVQKYLNLTSHVTSWIYVVIGEKQFQSMPDDLQEKVLAAGQLMQRYHEKAFVEQEDNLRKELETHGMVFIEPDREAFRKKTEKTVLDFLPEEYKRIYLQINQMNIKDENH
jgi:tripartite ATP-independent transporter DctP family solute receptor